VLGSGASNKFTSQTMHAAIPNSEGKIKKKHKLVKAPSIVLRGVQDKAPPSPTAQIVHFYVIIIIISFMPMHPSSDRILLINFFNLL
jgi:hypothetical protein